MILKEVIRKAKDELGAEVVYVVRGEDYDSPLILFEFDNGFIAKVEEDVFLSNKGQTYEMSIVDTLNGETLKWVSTAGGNKKVVTKIPLLEPNILYRQLEGITKMQAVI